MIWELVHGHDPWFGLDRSEALLRRADGAPEPERGPPILVELLRGLLQADPANRPDAAHVVDRLEQHGILPPPPEPAALLRRARKVWVFGPDLRRALDGWLEGGPSLALVGPPGSGRTHTLDWLALELLARGRPFVRLEGTGRPWVVVEQALLSPSLPGAPRELPCHEDLE